MNDDPPSISRKGLVSFANYSKCVIMAPKTTLPILLIQANISLPEWISSRLKITFNCYYLLNLYYISDIGPSASHAISH